MFLLVFFADYLIWVYILSPVAYWLKGKRRAAIMIAISSFLAWSLAWLIKTWFYIPRPFIFSGRLPGISALLDGSFPSSHTALAIGVAGAFWHYNRKISVILFIGGILIGSARVILGVHTPLDIFGGALLAMGCALVVRQVGTNMVGSSRSGD